MNTIHSLGGERGEGITAHTQLPLRMSVDMFPYRLLRTLRYIFGSVKTSQQSAAGQATLRMALVQISAIECLVWSPKQLQTNLDWGQRNCGYECVYIANIKVWDISPKKIRVSKSSPLSPFVLSVCTWRFSCNLVCACFHVQLHGISFSHPDHLFYLF